MSQHIQEAIGEHMLMTKRALDAKDSQIKELQEICEMQDQKIKSLEKKGIQSSRQQRSLCL